MDGRTTNEVGNKGRKKGWKDGRTDGRTINEVGNKGRKERTIDEVETKDGEDGEE